jgi:phosphomannomutase
LRATPPSSLLGGPVVVEDLLPEADVLRWRCPGGRVVVRPTGTEPKLKAYLEVVADSSEQASTLLRDLRSEVTALLGF